MGSSLPPETPTRALLKRLHRRSSVLPASTLSNFPDQSLSLLGPSDKVSSQRADADGDSSEQEDSDATHCADDVSAGQRSINTIEESTIGQQDSQIRQLQWQIEELQKQKQEVEAELRKSKKKAKEGVTWDTARKLEREFEAQEMILKGLQRDNERRMIESERLLRKVRTMANFLERQHGKEWHNLVFGNRADKTVPEPIICTHAERVKSSRPKGRVTESSSVDEAVGQGGVSAESAPTAPLPGQWMSPAHGLRTAEPCIDQFQESDSCKAPNLGDTIQVASSTEEGNMTAVDASRWADAEASFDTTYADCSRNNNGSTSEEANREDSTECFSASKDSTSKNADDGLEALQPASKPIAPAKDQEIQDISQILASASLQEPSQLELRQSDETSSLKPPLHDQEALRAQLEETRLLLEGFARRSARREMELIEMQERARADLERGRETLEGVAEQMVCGAPQ